MLARLNTSFHPRSSYDVCIVGAGAAGITLAWKLRRLGASVFLAEGGDIDPSEESQELYQGEVDGDPYYDLQAARLRYFGGTTNHWGGMCRPLEAVDFEGKAASPDGEWPIRIDDLAPFLDEALGILELPPVAADRDLDDGRTIRRAHFVLSPPVRFGEKFRAGFASDDGIDVCLNANLVGVEVSEGRVTSARFRNYGEDRLQVVAKAYVLACGGIENSRLLLAFNRDWADRLGNGGRCVGAYWMEHPTATIGYYADCGNMSFADDGANEPYSRTSLFVAPTLGFMQRERILNCRIRLERPSMSAIGAAAAGLLCATPEFAEGMLETLTARMGHLGRVGASCEQEPLRSNRIELGDEPDRFGMPRPVLHWRLSSLVKRTILSVALRVGTFLARRDYGRLKLHEWVLAEDPAFACVGDGFCPGGYHHMGGTRMARSDRTGVVDSDGRIFGTENFFVAGASVFPSAGYANPTLTIVQLSLRLAAHLKDAMR